MRFTRESKAVVDTSKDVLFQIISWFTNDEEYGDDDDEDSHMDNTKYLVKIFGVNESGQSVSVNLTDFPPFFYVKTHLALNDFHLKMLRDYVVQKLPYRQKNCLLDVKVMKKKDFWGFTNNRKFSFIRLTFKNIQTFRVAAKIFMRKIKITTISNDLIYFKLYENNIDPFLRLAHIKNIDPAGWIRIPGKKFELNSNIKPTRCQIDISCRWSEIESATVEKMAPLLIASFDIECTSSHGDFPVAYKTYKKTSNEVLQYYTEDVTKEALQTEILLIFDHSLSGKLSKMYTKKHINPKDIEKQLRKFMDDIFSTLHGRMNYKKAGFAASTASNASNAQPITKDAIVKSLCEIFGKCLPALEGDPIIQIGTTVHVYGESECSYQHVITLGTCSDIPNVVVETCNNEKELLMKWRDLITGLDPDILTGYNILGFDMSYMYERARENNIETEFTEIGKLLDHPSKYVEKTLSSSALGDNLLKYVEMEGRVLIDMMKVVQRDHKLDSYKLDAVASNFLGGKISDFAGSILVFDNIKGISVDSYVSIDDDEEKFKVLSIVQKEGSASYDIELDRQPSKKPAKWGLAKDDITPKQIFECQNGTCDDRSKVAKYCIKDCALCNYLLMKLETLANNVGMANVCSVPLNYIFMRGQGVKIFSLVAKQCRSDDFLIPCLTKYQKQPEDEDEDLEGYEGAIVLEPKEGIYIESPISVMDYASLYPSSMISENLSHDCIVLDAKYDNLEGFEYLDIFYDIYETQGDKKVKTGEKRCRFVQLPDKGIIPRILMNLLKQRKLTRKKIEYKTIETIAGETYAGLLKDMETEIKLVTVDNVTTCIKKEDIKSVADTYNDFQKAVLDGLQLAYKVTANSLYGQCGAKTSQIYMKDIAACTTATGRKMIMLAKDYIEKNYDAEIVYGDSVTGDTPLLIRYQEEQYDIKTIDSITKDWVAYDNFKPWDEDRHQKQQSFVNAEVWADGAWAKIIRVIRHKTNKKLYRIRTLEGVVDVTEDHSLLDSKGQKIKPGMCAVGETELLHSFPCFEQSADSEIPSMVSEVESWIMGVFFRHGRCEQQGFWRIESNNLEFLEDVKQYFAKVEQHVEFEIETLPDGHRLVPVGSESTKDMIEKYRELFYDKDNCTKVPFKILNASSITKVCFLKGYLEANNNSWVFSHRGKIGAQGLYFLMSSIGCENVGVGVKDYNSYYIINLKKNFQNKNKVISIQELDNVNEESFVYDIETSAGKFQAGIGSINVSNTDSIFIDFHVKDDLGNPIKGKEAIPRSRELGQQVSKEFNKLIKQPHDLEWEKIFYPFVLFSKKRYCANKYEHDDHKCKMNSMGIVLKRRDNAHVVKTIYGGILDIILNEQNVRKSIIFLQDNLKNLVEGNYPLKEFIITKSLKSDYKDPDKIAHKMLADRMGERDEGTRPQVNDRIPYAYVETPKPARGKKLLQGNRIEHPDYIIAQNIKLDYEFYITNQIMKPCLQLYALVLEKLDGYKKRVDYVELKTKLLKEKDGDAKKAKDKWHDLREEEVKKLLFDPILIKLQNKKNKNTSITDFFGPKL